MLNFIGIFICICIELDSSARHVRLNTKNFLRPPHIYTDWQKSGNVDLKNPCLLLAKKKCKILKLTDLRGYIRNPDQPQVYHLPLSKDRHHN